MVIEIIEKINSSFGAAILALITITLILHILLVYPKNLTKKQWKKTDYIWLLLTATGLYGSTRSVEKMINGYQIPTLNQQISTKYVIMKSYISTGDNSWLCGEMVRTEYSPDNFEEIVNDYKNGCEWEKTVTKIINSLNTNNFQIIDTTRFPIITVQSEQLLDYLKHSLDQIKTYNQLVTERDYKEKTLERSSSDFMLQYFSPLLLILGISLRITKVSGELRYEKS